MTVAFMSSRIPSPNVVVEAAAAVIAVAVETIAAVVAAAIRAGMLCVCAEALLQLVKALIEEGPFQSQLLPPDDGEVSPAAPLFA